VILTTIYWVFGFLRMGTTGPRGPGPRRGRRGRDERAAHARLIIGVAAGARLRRGQAAVFAGAFRLAPASPEVEALARDYLAIRIWGRPPPSRSTRSPDG
jgi:MATE family multidrug resistance protein